MCRPSTACAWANSSTWHSDATGSQASARPPVPRGPIFYHLLPYIEQANVYTSATDGTNWTAVGSVADNSALLLAADANTRLYFQPTADFNGSVSNAITFHAWDQTSGTAGTKVDASVNGGTTAFSTATDTANITINPVNDAPVLDATKTPVLTAENQNSGAPSGVAMVTFTSVYFRSSMAPRKPRSIVRKSNS